jgi:hypothetical protein
MSEIEEDIYTESGKAIRLSSSDLEWCEDSSNCVVFIILSTRSAPLTNF